MVWEVFIIVGYVLSWAVIPVVLRANKPPVSTLNWIWFCILFPWIGPLAYLVFGSTHMARKHLSKREEMDATALLRRHSGEILPSTSGLLDALTDGERKTATLISNLNEAVVSSATGIKLLVDAPAFYPALLQAVKQARHHVHIEFFIFRADRYGREVVDALADAAARGVEVRLLCDQIGSIGTWKSFFAPLIEKGGRFAWFRAVHPVRNLWLFNLRNHRKIQIIDGKIAFVGGMNMGKEQMGEDPAFGSWRDVQVELHGQVATTVQRTFADDWYFATEEKLVDEVYYPLSQEPARQVVQVLSDGPDNDADPIQMSIVALLNAAGESAWLTAGYFVPNEPLLTALKLCAERGVDTRLLIAAKSDHPYLVQVGRSYYEELLEYGVRIFEYNKGMNHAKVAAIDHRWMMVGSANFDIRSMRLNFELNVLIDDPENTVRLEEVLRHDYEKDSEEIELEKFKTRSFGQRCLESLFRPMAPLL